MNTIEAKECAKNMSYSDAVSNCFQAKGVNYRKATFIKLTELAKLAKKLDEIGYTHANEPYLIDINDILNEIRNE